MYTVRKADPRDARSIAGIYVDSWRSTYAGLLPDELLVGLDADRRENRWWRHALGRRSDRHTVFVIEQMPDDIVGFVSGGPPRDRRFDYGGEVYALYVLDEHHDLGLGKRLFTTMAAHLVRTHRRSLIVWVLDGNPSRFFYEALGGKRVAHRHGTMGGAPIEEIAYAWEDARALVALGRSDQG